MLCNVIDWPFAKTRPTPPLLVYHRYRNMSFQNWKNLGIFNIMLTGAKANRSQMQKQMIHVEYIEIKKQHCSVV